MPTNFPTSIDDGTSLPIPTATSATNSPSHAGIHGVTQAAIVAVETKIGTGASTPTSTMLLRGTGTGSSAWDKVAPTGTIVGTTDSQTLTNKIITSPTISGGSIDNSTITVDSIGEHTAANGVAIDGLNIKDSKLNTNNSVVTANLTDLSVTNAKLAAQAWASWTPAWTNFTVGNGTLSYAKWSQIGKDVSFKLRFVLGTTSAVTGRITFSLPFTMATLTADDIIDGIATLYDTSAPDKKIALLEYVSSTTLRITASTADTTYTGLSTATGTSSTVPFPFATGDIITVVGKCEVA